MVSSGLYQTNNDTIFLLFFTEFKESSFLSEGGTTWKENGFCVTEIVLVSSSLQLSNKKLTNACARFKVVSFSDACRSNYLAQEKGLWQLD